MSQLLSFFWKNNIPRWSILIIDVIISAFSLTLAFFLRFNFAHIPEADLKTLPVAYSITLLVRFITFFISKTYKGVVRYTGSKDAMRILFVIIIGSSLLVLFDIITRITIGIFYIPLSVIIIDALVTMFIMICSRLAVKAIYFESRNPEKQKSTILIYGAGESGLITKRILDRDAAIKYKVVGFIDDDPKKKGRSLEGSFIYSPDKLESLISENDVESLIISILNISPSRKNEIIERCINQNIKVLTVPPVSKWINGELSFNQLKSVNIESLLERDPIKLNIDLIKNQY
jgi:FlaA1/EpsC-like NDP-sugar epimerase